MTYGKIVDWHDLPDSPGKRVLEEILSTPPVDREMLHQRSLAYQSGRKRTGLRLSRKSFRRKLLQHDASSFGKRDFLRPAPA